MADTEQNIFDFNHIDTTLPKSTVDMLNNLYTKIWFINGVDNVN